MSTKLGVELLYSEKCATSVRITNALATSGAAGVEAMNANNAAIHWIDLSTAVRSATRSLAQDAGTIAPGPESGVGGSR